MLQWKNQDAKSANKALNATTRPECEKDTQPKLGSSATIKMRTKITNTDVQEVIICIATLNQTCENANNVTTMNMTETFNFTSIPLSNETLPINDTELVLVKDKKLNNTVRNVSTKLELAVLANVSKGM